jgi:hypothetical protein
VAVVTVIVVVEIVDVVAVEIVVAAVDLEAVEIALTEEMIGVEIAEAVEIVVVIVMIVAAVVIVLLMEAQKEAEDVVVMIQTDHLMEVLTEEKEDVVHQMIADQHAQKAENQDLLVDLTMATLILHFQEREDVVAKTFTNI